MRDWIGRSVLALTVLVLAGCVQNNGADKTSADIDQTKLCQVDTWKPLNVANQCQPGQKVLYRPGGSGDAEQAALFAAANCDLRYTVAVTPGGTACIYKPISSANALPGGERAHAEADDGAG
ncbi:hypothetical protein [Salinisphaera sp. Q1T1-3]|uniref:hypothetical protein n=1 Tax=Salinisphaera sp. Q1T1-3 TaxID=2321229 RepID=UPI000E724FB4|nr:hypothetical protein [Salinisphaera sp. Q1T1-3]RJS94128.1 hypothetical protein D3260_06090 [Salinisphaera sp. Q1T1-3]